MKLQTFIDDNREEIDILIRQNWPNWNDYQLDDDEREVWIMNHEPLYILAKQAGVDV